MYFKPEHRKRWRWKRVTCELIGLGSNSDGGQKDQGHQEYLRGAWFGVLGDCMRKRRQWLRQQGASKRTGESQASLKHSQGSSSENSSLEAAAQGEGAGSEHRPSPDSEEA